jgi:hypothetical protein
MFVSPTNLFIFKKKKIKKRRFFTSKSGLFSNSFKVADNKSVNFLFRLKKRTNNIKKFKVKGLSKGLNLKLLKKNKIYDPMNPYFRNSFLNSRDKLFSNSHLLPFFRFSKKTSLLSFFFKKKVTNVYSKNQINLIFKKSIKNKPDQSKTLLRNIIPNIFVKKFSLFKFKQNLSLSSLSKNSYNYDLKLNTIKSNIVNSYLQSFNCFNILKSDNTFNFDLTRIKPKVELNSQLNLTFTFKNLSLFLVNNLFFLNNSRLNLKYIFRKKLYSFISPGELSNSLFLKKKRHMFNKFFFNKRFSLLNNKKLYKSNSFFTVFKKTNLNKFNNLTFMANPSFDREIRLHRVRFKPGYQTL